MDDRSHPESEASGIVPGTAYVSTAEVAGALGVSVATVKRWVDQGILPAHRTPGGHRKILLEDVRRIVREGDFPRRDLSLLGLSTGARAAEDPAARSGSLLAALKRGDGDAVRTLLRDALQSGLAMETLADAVVAPAMKRLGHEWAEGRLDVLDEHRGTLLCAAALFELRATLDGRTDPGRPLAVGGGPEGDPYLLANLLAEMVLRGAGWRAIDLGPNTPLSSFRLALSRFRPRLIWISVSHLADPDSFLRGYHDLYREAERSQTAVAVGGQALTEAVRARMPYTFFGDGLTHLAAFARSLEPPPQRPRRGRPRRRA